MATVARLVCLAMVAFTAGWRSGDGGQGVSVPFSPHRSIESLELRGVGSVIWSRSFGSENDDSINRIVETADGSLVAVGFADRTEAAAEWRGLAHRFAPDGRAIWTKRFGRAGLNALWGAAEAADGRLALSGFAQVGGVGATDAWLLVVDHAGDTIREEHFGGPAADRAIDVVACDDGGFLLVGQTESFGGGERDVFVVRTDADGQAVWTRAYGGVDVDRGFYAAATADGGFVVSGVTGNVNAYDMLVIKVDDQGHELWRRVFGGEGNDPNHGVNTLPDGRIVVVGYTESWGVREHDLLAITLSASGELLSSETLGGKGDDRVMTSITAADGGTWLVGYTTSFGNGNWDVMLARLTPEGHFEPWLGAIGTSYDDQGTTLVETAGSDLVVGGQSSAASHGSDADVLLFRIDPQAIERKTEGVIGRRVE